MSLNIIITGASGMVGRGVLLECIDSPDIGSILMINRNPLDVSHPKITEVILKDFFQIDTIRDHLAGFDAAFYCTGVTSVGVNEAEYTRIMFDMTMILAKAVLSASPNITFCFVSGQGTDSSENGSTMWARIKGKAENALLGLGFKYAYMFRPGLIIPRRGIRSRTWWYNAFYAIVKPFGPFLRKMPKHVTDTSTIGKAMINVVLYGYPKAILESEDINVIGR